MFLHIYWILTTVFQNADTKPRISSSSWIKFLSAPNNNSLFLKWKLISADGALNQFDFQLKEEVRNRICSQHFQFYFLPLTFFIRLLPWSGSGLLFKTGCEVGIYIEWNTSPARGPNM